MRLRLKKTSLSGIILLVALLTGSVITSCHFFAQQSMDMRNSGGMADTHFDSQNPAACCQMSNGHNAFQNTVADVVKKSSTANNNFAFSINFILLFAGFWLIADKILLAHLYRARRILSIAFNYLVQAFSQGILQPQIYNV